MPTAATVDLIAPRQRKLRVLLVEDNVSDVVLMADVFSGFGDQVEFEVCPDAPQMFSFLRAPGSLVPDVLLLDLHITGHSGLDVLTELKRDPHLRRIPVVIISGSSDPRDIDLASQKHASAYLVKPMAYEQLWAQMNTFVTFWKCCAVIG